MGRIKLEISQIYVFDTRISTTKPIVRRIVCVCAHAHVYVCILILESYICMFILARYGGTSMSWCDVRQCTCINRNQQLSCVGFILCCGNVRLTCIVFLCLLSYCWWLSWWTLPNSIIHMTIRILPLTLFPNYFAIWFVLDCTRN